MRSTILMMAFLAAVASHVDAKRAVVKVAAQDLVTGSFERGKYVVVSLPIPEEVMGKRLDAVILEFFVDAASDELFDAQFMPSIELYPLVEANRVDRSPVYLTGYPTSRPVALGERQHVQVDIGDIVRRWIAQPATNFGLIIGSFSGPVLDDLEVRSDVLDGGHAIQATFHYQNRFGQRVSSE